LRHRLNGVDLTAACARIKKCSGAPALDPLFLLCKL
jgi:hypothetical protein